MKPTASNNLGTSDLNERKDEILDHFYPVLIGGNKEAFGLWKGLFDEGIFVNVFIPPATPPNKSMMRNSFMATHEKEHLEKVVDCYTKIGKRLGII